MNKNRPTYTREFKEQAVRLSMADGKTIDDVAAELGVSASSIGNWRKAQGVSESRVSEELRAARAEVEQLRRQLKMADKEKKAMAMENEVLKKAAAFFARNQA